MSTEHRAKPSAHCWRFIKVSAKRFACVRCRELALLLYIQTFNMTPLQRVPPLHTDHLAAHDLRKATKCHTIVQLSVRGREIDFQFWFSRQHTDRRPYITPSHHARATRCTRPDPAYGWSDALIGSSTAWPTLRREVASSTGAASSLQFEFDSEFDSNSSQGLVVAT